MPVPIWVCSPVMPVPTGEALTVVELGIKVGTGVTWGKPGGMDVWYAWDRKASGLCDCISEWGGWTERAICAEAAIGFPAYVGETGAAVAIGLATYVGETGAEAAIGLATYIGETGAAATGSAN